jgi:hypothetical protein
MARSGYQLGTAAAGEVANKAMETAKGNYLANLVLYPGGLVVQGSGLSEEHVKSSSSVGGMQASRAT